MTRRSTLISLFLAALTLALASMAAELSEVEVPPAARVDTPNEAAETPSEAETSSRSATPDREESEDGGLPKRFANWLFEVEPLITGVERQLFLALKKDYQRDAFIQQFWKIRDPYPRTTRNEFKDRWPLLVAEARSKFGGLGDDRSRVMLVHGKPTGSFQVRCTKSYSAAEVWLYNGSYQFDHSVVLIFVRPTPTSETKVWNPDQGRSLLEQVLRRARGCINGAQLRQVISSVSADIDNYSQSVRAALIKPRPRSLEWVQTFVAHSTDVPADAELIDLDADFGFLGRHQNRTVVQGLLNVPLEEISVGEFAGYRSHDLLLTGEIVLGDTLFESFRYKYGFPEEPAPGSLPLIFQRYLRPGEYRVVLKLEDVNSNRVARIERQLEVPLVDDVYEIPTFKDPRTEQLFAEATAAIEAGETGIRIIPPQDALYTGFVRFDSLVSGDEIRKVRFFLDDKYMLTKNRPPFNVEIDLGSFPDLHLLRAEALDENGDEVASDEVLINSGGYRFTLKLVEPRRGQRYERSLRARAEIEVPEGRSLERVEFFLNETLVATLYQEPWVQPIVLPEDEAVAYVRAVAHLPDGNTTEDLVFINAPDYLEELEIQFVELYTTVLDNGGRPVQGVGQNEFTVFEDGVKQQIARFELVENLPIHVGILIDNSASMAGTLGEVRKAALSFFHQAINAKDRCAVITFNSFPDLAVELTSDRAALGSGLAGLTAEGRTALYDSVMFALYYFTGIKGQRAILVLSDGKDESSRFDFAKTLDYARRAGITIYSIGFRLTDGSARGKLARLADETGGSAFFIRDISELESIYSQIQRELRSQYLIAYQSSNTEQDEEFRSVDLKINRQGVEVKTLSGYYP